MDFKTHKQKPPISMHAHHAETGHEKSNFETWKKSCSFSMHLH
jgi:hypothetical protein